MLKGLLPQYSVVCSVDSTGPGSNDVPARPSRSCSDSSSTLKPLSPPPPTALPTSTCFLLPAAPSHSKRKTVRSTAFRDKSLIRQMGRPLFGLPDTSITHPTTCACDSCVSNTSSTPETTDAPPSASSATLAATQIEALIREQSQSTTTSLRRVTDALEEAYTRLRVLRESLEALSSRIMPPPVTLSLSTAAPAGMAPAHDAIILSSGHEGEHGTSRSTNSGLPSSSHPTMSSSLPNTVTTGAPSSSQEMARLMRARAHAILQLISTESNDPNDSRTSRGRRVALHEQRGANAESAHTDSHQADVGQPIVTILRVRDLTLPSEQTSDEIRRRVLERLSAPDVLPAGPRSTPPSAPVPEADASGPEQTENSLGSASGSSAAGSRPPLRDSLNGSWDERTRRLVSLAQRLRGAISPGTAFAIGSVTPPAAAPQEHQESDSTQLYRIRRQLDADGMEIVHPIRAARGAFPWREGDDEDVVSESQPLNTGERTPVTLEGYRAARARRRTVPRAASPCDDAADPVGVIVFGSDAPFTPSPFPILSEDVAVRTSRKREYEGEEFGGLARRPFMQR